MIDAAGNTTTYGYDAVGNSTGRTDALGASLVWTYDPLGNRTAQRNRTDPVLTTSVGWTYDPFGRILTRTADSATTTYTYDVSGNRLTATAGGQTITTTYDRLNRVLSVDDEDADTTAETTYTYGLTSGTRVDVTGTYTATLDKFDRATVLDDPVNASNFTWSYQGDGQVKDVGQPNGNTTAHIYNGAGRLTSRDTTAGATNRALYDWTYNRAGQVLTEATTVTGDPTNNTRSFASDPLARLASFTDGATTTAFGWPAVANRTSVKVGAGASVPTAYDAANRPTDQNGVANAYTSDADGRLTARPTSAGAAYQQFTWDHLGRLTAVKNGAGTTIATYTYDPLDRLRMVDYGSGNRTRFRYQGATTSAVQTINDATSAVIRSIGTSWTGELLEDWTGAGSNLRIYGTNGHHDVTWAASSAGAVTGTVRYDPWGTATSTTGSVPDFRFQSSWADDTTKLSWVVTRWYAAAEGRFLSEDSLLGHPEQPSSRHLHAYGLASPLTLWDPDGRDGLPTPAPAPAPDICKTHPKSCATMTWEQRRISRLLAQAHVAEFWRTVGALCFDTREPFVPYYTRNWCWGIPFGTGIRYIKQGGRTLVSPSTWDRLIRFVRTGTWRVKPRPLWLLAEIQVGRFIGVPRNAGRWRMYFGPVRYRIPDFDPRITIPLRGSVVEVKLTVELRWTRQLEDFLNYARRRGARLEIYTDASKWPDSSSPFWTYVARGDIVLRRIP